MLMEMYFMKHILFSEYMHFTYMTDNKKRFSVFLFFV